MKIVHVYYLFYIFGECPRKGGSGDMWYAAWKRDMAVAVECINKTPNAPINMMNSEQNLIRFAF